VLASAVARGVGVDSKICQIHSKTKTSLLVVIMHEYHLRFPQSRSEISKPDLSLLRGKCS